MLLVLKYSWIACSCSAVDLCVPRWIHSPVSSAKNRLIWLIQTAASRVAGSVCGNLSPVRGTGEAAKR